MHTSIPLIIDEINTKVSEFTFAVEKGCASEV